MWHGLRVLMLAGLTCAVIQGIVPEAFAAPKAEKGSRMDSLKQDLSRRFGKVDPAMKSYFEQEAVVAERVPTPFLKDGGIVRIIDRGVRVVRPFYVGHAGEDFAVFLAGNREGFRKLCQQGKFAPGTEADLMVFLRTLLETTSAQPSRFFLLSGVDEIRPRPQLTPDEEASFKQFIDRYRGTVRPPVIRSVGSDWLGVAFGLYDIELRKYEVKLEANGSFDVRETVLEGGLPIPMVIH
jgi:hypothetical protein